MKETESVCLCVCVCVCVFGLKEERIWRSACDISEAWLLVISDQSATYGVRAGKREFRGVCVLCVCVCVCVCVCSSS